MKIITLIALCLSCSISVQATFFYWDSNGDTPGAGGAPTGTWGTDAYWSTNEFGTNVTVAWDEGSVAVFSAGTDAIGAFTINVSGTQTADYLSFEEGEVTLSGGTLILTNATGTIDIASGLTATVNSALAGTTGLRKGNPGTLIIGGANTYSGPTAVSGGTLKLGASDLIPNGSALTVDTVAIFDLNSFNETVGSLAGAGTVTLTGGTLTAGGDNTSTAFTGNVSGSGLFVKTGSGTFDHNTAGAVSAPVAVTGGIYQIDASARLSGTDTVTLNGGTFRNANAGAGNFLSIASREIVIGGSGGTIDLNNSAQVLIFEGLISGANNTLYLTGGGELRFRTNAVNAAYGHNTFAKLVIDGGYLTLGQSVTPAADDSLGAVPAVTTDDALTLKNGGRLRANVVPYTLDNKRGITIGTGGGILRSINTSAPLTVPGTVKGSNLLIIGGGTDTGIVTLSNTGNTFGSLAISNSTLRVGASGVIPDTSPLTISFSGGGGAPTLALNGFTETVGPVILTGTNATISLPGTLTGSSLDIQGSEMRFDLARAGFPTATVFTNTGNLTMNGNVAVNVRGFNTTGSATLMQYAGSRSGGGSFQTGMLPPHITGTITDDTVNQKIILNVTIANTLRWKGDASANWTVNDSGNATWRLVSDNTTTYYQENTMGSDTVLFDDTATGGSITVTGTVSPFSITVTNTAVNLTLTGAGLIGGSGGLTKRGTGALTISLSGLSTYTGAVSVEAGSLAVTAATHLGGTAAGTTVASGAALQTSTTATIAEPLTLNGTGIGNAGALRNTVNSKTFSGAITLGSSGVRINADANTLTLSGGISGSGNPNLALGGAGSITASTNAINIGTGTLTKDGAGTLTLSTPNTIGGLVLNLGRITVGDTLALSSGVPLVLGDTVGSTAVSLNAAVNLTGANALSGAVTLNQTLTIVAGSPIEFSGPVTLVGSRQITVNSDVIISGKISGNGGLTRANAGGVFTLRGTNDYTGSTTFNNAVSVVSGGNNRLPVTTAVTLGNTGNSATLRLGDVSAPSHQTITGLTTAGTGTANAVVGGNASVSILTLNVSGTSTYGGLLGGVNADENNLALVKTGVGTFILTGTNSLYSGGTTVNGGILRVNNITGSGTGSGSVTVNSGGTLGGTGIISGSVLVNSGGTLAPGNSIGTLTNNNDLTLQGTALMEVSRAGGAPAADRVTGIGTLNVTGGLVVTNIGVLALRSGDAFQLFDATTRIGSFAPVSLPPLLPGLSWNTSGLNSAGSLSISGTVIPPQINTTTASGGNLTASGTGGVANGTYYVLATFSLTNALSAWTSIATNTFDGTGNFTFGDVINLANPQRFYTIVIP